MPSKSGWGEFAVIVVVLVVIVLIANIWITGIQERNEQTRAMSTAKTCYVGIVLWMNDNPGFSRAQISKMTLDDFVREGAISAGEVEEARRLSLLFRGYDPEAAPATVVFEREKIRWGKKKRMVFRTDGSGTIE